MPGLAILAFQYQQTKHMPCVSCQQLAGLAGKNFNFGLPFRSRCNYRTGLSERSDFPEGREMNESSKNLVIAAILAAMGACQTYGPSIEEDMARVMGKNFEEVFKNRNLILDKVDRGTYWQYQRHAPNGCAWAVNVSKIDGAIIGWEYLINKTELCKWRPFSGG